MQRGWPAAVLGAWLAQVRGNATRRCRLQPASNHGGDRTQIDVVARALYQARRSSASRARSFRAIQGRARTESTQQRNPSLPNSEKALTHQRDILMMASPAEVAFS